MKAIEDMTIQEMVARLEFLKVSEILSLDDDMTYSHGYKELPKNCKGIDIKNFHKVGELTRALDEKCLVAGISIEGEGKMLVLDYFRCFVSGRKLIESYTPAADIHALLGYLLGKEE